MYKPNNKKMLTVLISVFMVFSAFAVLSLATTPAFAASGTVTADPTVFVETSHNILSTLVVFNGGTFGSGSALSFYISTTTTFSADTALTASLVPSGTVKLPAGATTMSDLTVFLSGGSAVITGAGTYYIAVSDDSGATLTSPVAITVVASSSTNPEISSIGTVTPGEQVTVTSVSSHSFESGSSVTLYLGYAGNTTLLSSVSASSLASGVTVTIPTNLPGAASGKTYYVVAQESSASSTFYGVTAYNTFSLEPAITVSPISINGATSSSFTVTGHGFPASDSFKASTSLNPETTFEIPSATYEAINPAFTSDSSGSFTVTVSGLVTAITTFGSTDITMYDSSGTQFSDVGSIIVSVPNPAALGFSFLISKSTVSNVYNVNNTVTITVWNFPASQGVTFWMGSTEVGSGLTTDSNGAGTQTTVVPAVPGGITYKPTAVVSSSDLSTIATTAPTSYLITASFQVVDPSGTAISSTYAEYAPSTALFTVQALGLNPSTSSYDFKDSLVASSGIGANGLVTSVSVGTESSSTGEFTPAANGTLIFTYSPGYTVADVTTGTSIGSITSSNSVGGLNSTSYEYYAIGDVSFSHPSTDYRIYAAGATAQTLTVTDLIGASEDLYPGMTSEYNAYIGSTELTLAITPSGGSTTTGTVFDSTDTLTFNVPSTNGVFNFNITYNGESVATGSVGARPIVISTAGSSYSDGSLYVAALTTGYEVVGYGYYTAPHLHYVTSNAIVTNTSIASLTDGAFATTINPTGQPAGNYSVFTQISSGGTQYFVYSSYEVSANLTLSSVSGTSPTGLYTGNIGTTVYVLGTGLVGTTYYNVNFGSNNELTDTGSALAAGTDSFTVPTVAAGKYTVTVTPVGSTVASESAGFKVTANSAISLSTNSQYAFPGQLVQFSATGYSTSGNFVGLGAIGHVQYYAQIALNGTIIATVPAALSGTTLTGSFVMPNNATGSSWNLTITAYVQIGTVTSTGSSLTGGSFLQVAVQGTQSDFFGIVSGNGALLTGISSGQIATLEADVNSTVSTSLTVPISQLNAAITSINGAVATLKTTVGNITTDLSTINATVASIEAGQVLVQSDLGSISTSLASLNSSLVAFNNNVVTINTTLGQVVTSVGSIGTTVTANANGIATIKTDVGTLQGQIVSTNGNISTIKTSLGTLTANVSKVSTQTSGFPTLEIFLIVIIVLVLITLVISFLAVSAANKAARRSTEEKKQ